MLQFEGRDVRRQSPRTSRVMTLRRSIAQNFRVRSDSGILSYSGGRQPYQYRMSANEYLEDVPCKYSHNERKFKGRVVSLDEL